jgi:hypothetical protein
MLAIGKKLSAEERLSKAVVAIMLTRSLSHHATD